MKKLFITIFIFIGLTIFSHKSEAAIARDQYSGQAQATATSLTYSATVTSTTSNPVLFVGVTVNGLKTISSVTYNAVPMTQVNTVTVDGNYRGYLFYLANPSTGTNNVVVTPSASALMISAAGSWTGVNQSLTYTGTQTDNQNIASCNPCSSLATATTTIADNSWAVLHGFSPGGNNGAGTGSTALGTGNDAVSLFDNKDNGAITPPANYSMTIGLGSDSFLGMIATMSPFVPATSIPPARRNRIQIFYEPSIIRKI